MLRIYLDTNLLTKIDNRLLLKEKLLVYSDYLNIVYSSAHITDLEKSSNTELTLKDLHTIRFYSENQCLAKYWGEDNLRYDTRDPIEFYETSKDTTLDLSDLSNDINEKLKKLGVENPFNKLSNLKCGFGSPETENQQSNFSYFKRFKKEQTFDSLFDDISEVFRVTFTSNEFLKEVRNIWDERLSRKIIGNVKTENVIVYLNEELPKTGFKKTFDELVEDSLKIRFNDKPYTYFDWFVTRYSTLDLIGYKSDNKSTTPNIVADGLHAFYGAHCDILISEDRRFREKAKVLYEESNIKTLIFSEKEFLESIDNIIIKIQDTKSYTDFLGKIRSLEVEYFYSDINTKSTIVEYSLETFFAGYFNYACWEQTTDNSNIITLIKINNSLSRWLYYKELKSLIKLLINWLGADSNNQSFFIDESQEILQDGTWKGRVWDFEKLFILLTEEKNIGLILRVGTRSVC